MSTQLCKFMFDKGGCKDFNCKFNHSKDNIKEIELSYAYHVDNRYIICNDTNKEQYYIPWPIFQKYLQSHPVKIDSLQNISYKCFFDNTSKNHIHIRFKVLHIIELFTKSYCSDTLCIRKSLQREQLDKELDQIKNNEESELRKFVNQISIENSVRYKNIMKDFSALKSSIGEYNKEISSLKSSIGEQNKEITILKSSIEEYNKEISRLKSSIENKEINSEDRVKYNLRKKRKV